MDRSSLNRLEELARLLDVPVETARELLGLSGKQTTPLAELESIYHTAPVGLAIVDTDLRFVRVNQRLAEINGVSVEDHIGRTLREVIPHLVDQIEPLYRYIFETGNPVLDIETQGETAAMPGIERTWSGNIVPLRNAAGNITGLSVVMQEVTEFKREEKRRQMLQELTAALSGALTMNEILPIILERGFQVLGGNRGWLGFLTDEGDALRLVSYPPILSEAARFLSLTKETALTQVAHTGQPVWLRNYDDYLERYPDGVLIDGESQASFCAPLKIHGEVKGVLAISYPQPQLFTSSDQDFILTLAQIFAQAIERARLFEAEAKARKQAEKTAERITRLYTITVALSEALTVNQVGQIVIDQGVDILGAKSGTFQLVMDNAVEIVYQTGIQRSAEELAQWRRYPLNPAWPVPHVIQTQQPLWFKNGPEVIEQFPAMVEVLKNSPGASTVLPLIVADECLGVVSFVFHEERTFNEEDRALMLALTEQCAQALDRAALYEAEQKARREAEKAADRITRLHIVTTALSEALTVNQVGQIVVDQGVDVLGAKTGTFQLLIEDMFNIVYRYDEQAPMVEREKWYRYPAAPSLPATQVVTHKQPVWFKNAAEVTERFPVLANVASANPGASVLLPVMNIGVLSFIFAEERVFSEDELSFLMALAEQCGQALERARLYEVEQRARLEAERADRLKLQFLAMISHELRTPLTSIKGFITTLLATDVEWTPENQHEFLNIANDEADKLTELVEELLDLSRLQAGALSIKLETQDLDLIIEMAQNELEALTRHHRLHLHIDRDLPLVLADPRRVTQILTNLVGNAAKYSPPQTDIWLRAYLDKGFVRIDVRDQGEGIVPEYRSLVFEAFRQADRKGLGHKKGAGLGLAICKGLVEAHGGRIWIEDCPEPGTMLSFTLRPA